jgi:hypothetical protein
VPGRHAATCSSTRSASGGRGWARSSTRACQPRRRAHRALVSGARLRRRAGKPGPPRRAWLRTWRTFFDADPVRALAPPRSERADEEPAPAAASSSSPRRTELTSRRRPRQHRRVGVERQTPGNAPRAGRRQEPDTLAAVMVSGGAHVTAATLITGKQVLDGSTVRAVLADGTGGAWGYRAVAWGRSPPTRRSSSCQRAPVAVSNSAVAAIIPAPDGRRTPAQARAAQPTGPTSSARPRQRRNAPVDTVARAMPPGRDRQRREQVNERVKRRAGHPHPP